MKKMIALGIMLTMLFALFLAGIHNAEAEGSPKVSLNPTSISAEPGTSFSVDVVLENATDLVAWEFKLSWNNFVLECVENIVHIPPIWENHMTLGPGIEQNYTATQGRYFRGLMALPMQEPDPTPFNGTMTLVTLTFDVKIEGSCILDLNDTKLADYDAYLIDHEVEDGYFKSQTVQMSFFSRACAKVAATFGATLEDPRWNPAADINADGIIDLYDMVLLIIVFGKSA